jgi:hypothetical protein
MSDGVYRTNAKGESEFVEAAAPSDEQVWDVDARALSALGRESGRANGGSVSGIEV